LRQKADEERQRTAAAELNFYSAVDNPFNDADIGQQFVWGKKRDKEKKAGLSMDEASRRDASRRADAKVRRCLAPAHAPSYPARRPSSSC
jgi:hypothetical protein